MHIICAHMYIYCNCLFVFYNTDNTQSNGKVVNNLSIDICIEEDMYSYYKNRKNKTRHNASIGST